MFDVALVNHTPFAADTHVQMDGDGQEVLVAVVCATFAAPDDEGPVRIAPEQQPVRFVDGPRGDPALSSIAFESDISPFKPRVDVIVEAAAHAAAGRLATEALVSLRLADIDKTLRVVGDRRSARDPLPAPFATLPIVYERAFGGTTPQGKCCVENPVGVGWHGAPPVAAAAGTAAPNIEYADPARAKHGAATLPAGFGIVARHWSPRIGLAGTYDAAWLDSRWPLAPADFDPLFHQVAPLDQQTASITGGETVTLTHVTPSGFWRFRLPRLDVPMHLVHEDRVEPRPLRIDTVAIDANLRTVTLKWRLAVRRVRNAPALRSIVLGHVTPAWLSARRSGKTWLTHGRGVLLERPLFEAEHEEP
jgi:hypothetical protein